MRVKVHPHRTMVNSGITACVSITPEKKHARAYYMGTVSLKDVRFRIHESGVKRAQQEQVRNVHAWAVGELMNEFPEQYPPDEVLKPHLTKVTYHFNIGRFITIEDYRNGIACYGEDVTDKNFRAAYIVGRDFYVAE